MKLRYILTVLVLGLLLPRFVQAQELNCTVVINSDQVQATNRNIFKTLETAVRQFMSERRWTDDDFEIQEKIECAVLITINKYNQPDQFEGTIQIQYSRPVYNTNYNSPLLNTLDPDLKFTYQINSPIEFVPNQFRSNLSSILAYYAYIILGLDYDSFEKGAGQQYFETAQKIATVAENNGFTGWQANDGLKNRHWLVRNLLDDRFGPLRDCFYDYHRLGFDAMYENADEGRKVVGQCIDNLVAVNRAVPLSFNMQVFFNTKRQELIDLYKQAPQAEKQKVVPVLKKLDPASSSKYDVIFKP